MTTQTRQLLQRQGADQKQRVFQRGPAQEQQALDRNPGESGVGWIKQPAHIQVDNRKRLPLRAGDGSIKQAGRARCRLPADAMRRAAQQAALQQLIDRPNAGAQGLAGWIPARPRAAASDNRSAAEYRPPMIQLTLVSPAFPRADTV